MIVHMAPEVAHEWPEFFERLAHDLREPLRTIHSFSELIHENAKKCGDLEMEQALKEIFQSTARMRTLIDGLIRYSSTLTPEPALGESSLQLAFDLAVLAFEKEINASGATVTGEKLPRVAIGLEELSFLMECLIGNSLRFRSEAAPAIHVSARPELENGGWLVHVQDNGIGIEPGDREAVFRPFMRVYGRKYPGAGLGLTASRRLLQSYGGKIWMEQPPQGGCLCAFTVPSA